MSISLFFYLHKKHCLSFTLPSSHSLVISASTLIIYLSIHSGEFRVWIECKLFSPRLSCFRYSSAYVCPTGMRALPLGSFCDGGERSVGGGATGSTAHLRPKPCPPRCSGPTGRPLHDRGCVMQSHVLAMKFLPTLALVFFFLFFLCGPSNLNAQGLG